jgi:hypothetical protein
MLDLDNVKTRLGEAGIFITSEERTTNDLGWLLRLDNGES